MVTIFVTTAPQPSIPSIKVIKEMLASIAAQPLLRSQQLVIAFDGGNLPKAGGLHRKCMHTCNIADYNLYKSRVKKYAQQTFPNVHFVELDERGCLTTLLKTAMEAMQTSAHMIHTDIVMVLQQDLKFTSHVPLEDLINVLLHEEENGVQCILFPLFQQSVYKDYVDKKCHKATQGPQHFISLNSEDALVQSLRWSDTNHIATIKHYNTKVWPNVKSGDFMEHAIECFPIQDHTAWGVYELIKSKDSKHVWISHLNGRHTR